MKATLPSRNHCALERGQWLLEGRGGGRPPEAIVFSQEHKAGQDRTGQAPSNQDRITAAGSVTALLTGGPLQQ